MLIVTVSGCSVQMVNKNNTTDAIEDNNQNVKWSLNWTPNYFLSYNPSKWKLETANDNYSNLIFINESNCRITEPGPMGTPDDYSIRKIGSITYETVNRLSVEDPFMAYMAKDEIDSQTQCHPFFFVYTSKNELENCIYEAEIVLSTLKRS